MTWIIKQLNPTVHVLDIVLPRVVGSRERILVTSDRHIDSVYSNLELQRKHLKIAREHNYPVIDLGDVFDAMQGRKDPRSSRLAMKQVLLEKEEYFDAVIDYGMLVLKPYAKNFALIATGNHETSILKHNETHLTKRLVNRLNSISGGSTCMADYTGWIQLNIRHDDGRKERQFNIRYTHGTGGAAPVTKGVIQTNRRAVTYPDANIHISGHTHEAYIVPITQERINKAGTVRKETQWHIQVPSYKDATTGIGTGFEAEKDFMPTPLGAAWINIDYDPGAVAKLSAELAL